MDHRPILLGKDIAADLLGKDFGCIHGACKDHQAADDLIEAVDCSHTALGTAQKRPYLIRHAARLVCGADSGGFDSYDDTFVLIYDFSFRFRH